MKAVVQIVAAPIPHPQLLLGLDQLPRQLADGAGLAQWDSHLFPDPGVQTIVNCDIK